ncbi:MAG: hypothetical protein Q9195_009463 [Heterodermia aff. obscurata]
MPRSMAPPPSGEFSIRLTKSFGTTKTSSTPVSLRQKLIISNHPGQTPTEKTEIIGEPNRSANVKITNHVGKENQTILTKEGQIQADDVNTLLDLVKQLAGFPSNPNEDIYGFDTRIVLSTFEVQWDNGEEIEGDEGKNPTEENKQTFKDVSDSIQSLARQTAR